MEYEAWALLNRSREYLRLAVALDSVVFDSADDFPAHRVFRYSGRDVKLYKYT
jgi:hypothetical protein